MLIEIRYKQQWAVLRKWGSVIGNGQDLGVSLLGGLQEVSYPPLPLKGQRVEVQGPLESPKKDYPQFLTITLLSNKGVIKNRNIDINISKSTNSFSLRSNCCRSRLSCRFADLSSLLFCRCCS